MMGVYEIINIENGRSYVGSSHDIKHRWWYHVNALRKGKCHNRHLQSAWNKYGEGAFSFCVLELVDCREDLTIREQYWLDFKFEADDNPYNVARDADTAMRHYVFTDEVRRKISEAGKGRIPSQATRLKMSKAQKGHPVSEETRRKISEANKGRKISEENLQKLREGQKRYKPTKEIRQKISRALTGRTFSAEHRQRLSEANKGKKLSEEHKRKISEGGKGRVVSEETRRKLSAAFRGRFVSEETRKKISDAKRGFKHSKESCRRMSMARKGKPLSEKHKQALSDASRKPYPAFIHRETGEVIPAGENLARLCRERGFAKGSLGKVANRTRSTYKGWILLEEKVEQ